MATWLSMTNTNIHYVYCHMRKDTGNIFYVGKGSGNRCNSKSKRNNHWKNIVNKCGGFTSQIIASNITEQEAYNFERLIIQGINDQTDIKLCNMIGGGRGGSFNPSEEVRQKQRVAKLGRKLSEETKKKLAEARRSRVYKSGYKMNLTPEQRALRSEIARNQVWTKDRCEKISAARKGFKHSEETKAKISATKTGVKQIESHRKNTSVAVKNGGIIEKS
jgi:hypothetical protein